MELEQSTEIQKITTQSGDIVGRATGLIVADDQGVETASLILKDISDTKKSIEDRRTFFVKPLNDQVKKINDLFKSIAAPLLVADERLRFKIKDYRAEQAAILAKEQERLNKLAAKQQVKADIKAEEHGVEPVTVVAKQVAPQASMIGNMVSKKVWKFKVIDAAIVPRDYLIVDETLIRKAVQSGLRDIQGVEIYQEEAIAIR